MKMGSLKLFQDMSLDNIIINLILIMKQYNDKM